MLRSFVINNMQNVTLKHLKYLNNTKKFNFNTFSIDESVKITIKT